MSAVSFGKSADQSPITIVGDFLNSLDSGILNVSASHNVGGDFSKFRLEGEFSFYLNSDIKIVEIYVTKSGFVEVVGIGENQKTVSTMTFGGNLALMPLSGFSDFLCMACQNPLDGNLSNKVLCNDLGAQIEKLCGVVDMPSILPSEQHAQWQQARCNRDGVAPDGTVIPHLG